MSDITRLLQATLGKIQGVDLTVNTPVTLSVKVGGGLSNTELTKAILDRLVTLQNGSDVDTTYHTHDTVYTRTSILTSTGSGTAGSTHIGDDNSYSNFTPTAATVKGALSGIDTALSAATAAVALDGTFRIENTSDTTKKIAFSAAGISTATTRTITVPDANVNLGDVNTSIQQSGSRAFTANQPMGGNKLTGLSAGTTAGDSVRYEQAILTSGANAFGADQSMGGFKLTNLAAPLSSGDAVNKTYADNLLFSLSWKQWARAATTGALAAYTYANGSSGVGATITANSNGALAAQDGVTLVANDRLLVKNETAGNSPYNGIYVVTQVGDAGTPFILTRSLDNDESAEMIAAVVRLGSEGTTQAGYSYRQATASPITVGSTNISWVDIDIGTAYTFTNGIQLVANTVSAKIADFSLLANGSGLSVVEDPAGAIITGGSGIKVQLEASNPSLQISSNQLGVKFDPAGTITSGVSGIKVGVDNSTIEINSNSLRVKDAGITLAKLASNSVDENKIVSTTFSASGALTGGSGSKVAVAVDNSSVEISSNTIRIKTTAYDQSTITGGGGTAAAVQQAPRVSNTFTAGESFTANTSFAVRWGLPQNGETAGRIYKADKTTSSFDLFYVIGLAQSGVAVSAGQGIFVTRLGGFALGSNDTLFNTNDQGKSVFLTSAGAFSVTPPSTVGDAVTRIGVVKGTGTIDVAPDALYVN